MVELSSFMLQRMERSPQVSVVTNVAPNHLDWHTDMAEYTDAKRNIVRYQQASDRAVLNADNTITQGFSEGLRSDVFRFSRLHEVERGTYLGQDGTLYGRDGGEAVRSCRRRRSACPAAIWSKISWLPSRRYGERCPPPSWGRLPAVSAGCLTAVNWSGNWTG